MCVYTYTHTRLHMSEEDNANEEGVSRVSALPLTGRLRKGPGVGIHHQPRTWLGSLRISNMMMTERSVYW